tara:strand:+ start:1313 stop:2068 length:756 start_codon:yes stop_codon:yes gene_type:complete
MIKFFRKIRQKMLTENKFSKYLLYAIGEIILVVIGILIALQINNWNERKKERAQEQKYLIEIKKNLEADYTQIESVGMEYQNIISKIDSLHIFIKNAKPKTTDYKKLFHNIMAVSYIPKFTPQKNGYNNLISVGDINQIQNQELMKKIASHYNYIDYSNQLITETLRGSSRNDIHPTIKKLIGKKEFLADLGYEYSTTSISDEFLSKNEELISGLIYKKRWLNIATKNTSKWKGKTNNLIENITTEIEKRK